MTSKEFGKLERRMAGIIKNILIFFVVSLVAGMYLEYFTNIREYAIYAYMTAVALVIAAVFGLIYLSGALYEELFENEIENKI